MNKLYTVSKKEEIQKGKVLSEEALQIGNKRSKRQGRKGKINPTECRVPENSKERKEGLLN